MKIESTQHVTTRHSGRITGEMLREVFDLPDDAELTVLVPSGGDYSGMRLHLDADINLDARWTVES